jgi:opacity protein-like surface antigen
VNRYTILVVLLAFVMPAKATDITLLAGYQFNSDFEVASLDAQLSDSSPVSGSPGDNIQLDDGAAFSLGVDFVYRQNQNQRIGFYVSHQQTEFEDNAGLNDRDMDVTHVHFTAMGYYPEGKFEPFVMAGLGAGFFSPKDSSLKSETQFSMQVGAGANYHLTDNLLLRVDARWLPTFFNSSGSAFCSGGCTIRLSSDTYNQVQVNAGLMFRFR